MRVDNRFSIVLFGAALLLICVLGLRYSFAWRDASDDSVCRAYYARARTAVDTQLVDGYIARRARGRGSLSANLTCGELRTGRPPHSTANDSVSTDDAVTDVSR